MFKPASPRVAPIIIGAKWGFTLIEIAITISIIVIVSVVVYANFNEINDSGEIIAVSDKLREQVRVAQNFSLNGRMLSADKTPYGWGVYFDRFRSKYITYGDLNGSQSYDFPTKLLIHGTEWTSGTTFFDSSVSSTATTTKTVTIVGSATQTATAGQPVGNGFWSFASAGDYLSVPAGTDFNTGTSSFAIDFWFKPTSGVVNNATLVRYGNAGNTSFKVTVASASTTLVFTLYNDSSVASTTAGFATTTLSAGNWYHVAAVRDRQYLKLFVNGISQGVSTIATTTKMFFAADATLRIGCEGAPYTCNPGDIDEVRFVKGWAPWYQSFTPPTKLYSADEEKYQEVKLPPGPVFDKFYRIDSLGTTTSITSSMDVFFSPADYLMRLNGTSTTEYSAIITVNRGGSSKGFAGYTPRSFRVWPSGLISATTTP